MTVKEAASALDVPIPTIQRRLQKGHMQGEKVGRDWVIKNEEVERWKGRRVNPGPKGKTDA